MRISYLFTLITVSILSLMLTTSTLQAQQMAFGAKGGLSIGTHAGKRPLFAYHGALFFERMGAWQGEERQRRLGFVAQLGYHLRGASYTTGNPQWQGPSIDDLFRNVALSALLKGDFKTSKTIYPYYAAGLRLEATTSASVVNPFDAQFVTPINFGLWLGGGLSWEPGKLPFGLNLELNISPDLTPQIFIPAGTVYQIRDPFSNQTRQEVVGEDRRVINLSIELSLGVKFLLRHNLVPAEDF